MLPPALSIPGNVRYPRPPRVPTTNYPRHILIGRMAMPSTFGPDWCHDQPYHSFRRYQLRNKLGQLSQEVWSTTSDNNACSESDIKTETQTNTESDYTSPRLSAFGPPELAHVGARFDAEGLPFIEGQSMRPKGLQRSRAPELFPPFSKNEDEHSSSFTYRKPPYNYAVLETGSKAVHSAYGDDMAYLPDGGYNFNTLDSNYDNVWSDVSPNGQVDEDPLLDVTATGRSYQQPVREFPDLFYAHNQQKYGAYKRECSRFYKHNFPEFMRRGLQKHRCHIDQENIQLSTLEKAMKVPQPRGAMTEDKKLQWYRSARNMLFHTPFEDPILDCENSGDHDLEKGKRTYPKRTSGLRSGPRQGRTQRAHVSTPQEGLSHNLTDPDMDSMLNARAGNMPFDITEPFQQQYGQAFMPFTMADRQNAATLDSSILSGAGMPQITVSPLLQPLDTDASLVQSINSISPKLYLMYQATSNSGPPELRQQRIDEFRTLVDNITGSVYQYQTRSSNSLFASHYSLQPHPSSRNEHSAFSVSNNSVDQQNSPFGQILTPSHSALTPDGPSSQQIAGDGWTNRTQASGSQNR